MAKGFIVIPAQKNPSGKITRRRNVAAGFYDDSGFHPIRASFDYDGSRAGDRPKKKAKAKAKRRPKTKRR